ncbi:predicted protein [Paecilomyces variotii No. 5]|uniref:Aminoglycoside phosphotransferase domain-containing protein n=1 Tax=Byssochlamys spectabilis (strain No. 5 / NBRC 109023) TaxID=1356009 RepID=V5HS54_BYSSN|nr:predicted protein [Paecilomyces variotii No. 5]
MNFFGNRVIKAQNPDGQYVAIKFKPKCVFKLSEADMMDYANRCGILTPRVWECRFYGIDEIAMITDYVPGKFLGDVWGSLNDSERVSIKEQLKDQIRRFRECTQEYVGRINNKPARNPYQGIRREYIGPFATEKEFDDWCLDRIPSFKRWYWEWRLSRLRPDNLRFVLTHGDLFPRNIMVENAKVTGILDWENSGFSPEYVETAVAVGIYDYGDEE